VDPQSSAVKRANVEFYNFASFGEPERNLRIYAEENVRRKRVIENHRDFIGPITPFLEMGANAGHSSYMLTNEFGGDGFALDISAGSLRDGRAIQDAWNMPRSPIRVAGDAANLPFADGSLRTVFAFQMLSLFMDIESVFREVSRVLAPGGIFVFAEEPIHRLLSLRLYRCPYYDTMKPWERRLYQWGLLGFLVRDTIGSHQEESFGIRQNHALGLKDWDALVRKYFVAHEYEVFAPEHGWGERVVKKSLGSEWRASRMLGGTLSAICRKAGDAGPVRGVDTFEEFLRCPNCHTSFRKDPAGTLVCTKCDYRSPEEDGVYNLLPPKDRDELYPGDRADIIDFSIPGHEQRLLDGWYDLEGAYGNRYRWMGARASARLVRVNPGPQKLRIRCHASANGVPGEMRAIVNGNELTAWKLDRVGLYILEADLPDAAEYAIELRASPEWQVSTDDRTFTVNVGMIRLVPG
jgi:ubiquinone/menaquinone biosynthesis C-methylase UbiE